MDGALIAAVLLNGLASGAVYAIIALGLTFVFGLLHTVNFAHGHLMLTASYVIVSIQAAGGGFWLALLVACAAAAVAGLLLDALLFARVRDKPVNGLLISVGLMAVLANLQHEIWGPTAYRLESPVSGSVSVGFTELSVPKLTVIGATAAVLGLLALLLTRTRVGLATRATGQHSDTALLMGIPVERVRNLAFVISAVLAAVAGALIGFILPIDPVLESSMLITGFIALILGGAGSPAGAVLGGVILGLIQSVGITFFSAELADIASFLLLIAVLYLRPSGIVASRQEVTL